MSKLKLYPHQEKLLKENPSKHLLAWACGTGKTATAIAWSNNNKLPTLVVCPKSLVDNWLREIDKWSNGNSKFDVISKENFKKKYKEYANIKAIILDEAHWASGYKSQVHKVILEFILDNNINNILLLTATPYRSTPYNIFALANILGNHWKWFDFTGKFFSKIRIGSKTWYKVRSEVDGMPLKNKIAQLVNRLGSTVSMADVVDVPEHTWLREDFTINSEQKKACEELLDSTPIGRLAKVYQILNGTLKSDGYDDDKLFKCDKFSRALELIEENDKIAVVCRHTLELDRFRDTIKNRKVFILNGATPKNDRDKIIQEFNNSDNCVILIQAKVSEGYNLYTPVMMFYSLDWGLVEWTQMIGRPVRLDHLKSVVYINLVYKGTIDEAVYDNVVIKKQEFQAEIYNKKI